VGGRSLKDTNMTDTPDHGTFEDRGVRPIQAIAQPPRTGAVQRLAERLQNEFHHTAATAAAIAEAVEDPRLAREQLGRLSRVPVRGGTLYTLDVRANALRMLIDPVNPRTVGSIDYPAAAAVGARAKFWGPRDLSVDPDTPGELVFYARSPEGLADALDDAKGVLRDQNALADSVALNGVFFPLTVMPWRIRFDDGSELSCLVARDGSSRLNGSQENLGIAPSDPVLGAVADPRRSRAVVAETAALIERPQQKISLAEAARAHSLMVPVRIIVAYEPDPGADASLLDVVDEFVALVHLDPPTPWSPPAEGHKRADIVVEQLRREGMLSQREAEYFAGMMDMKSATARRLPSHPDERAARIAYFLMGGAPQQTTSAFARGIRQLTGKGQARKEDKAPIIASLVLRGAHWTSPNRRKSAESTLPRMYTWPILWDYNWHATRRPVDELLERAIKSLAEGKVMTPSALELAVRGSYYLVVHGALGRESFGQSGEENKDNRPPSTVLAELCRSEYGLRVLHRAVVDGHAGRPPLRIAPDGTEQVDGTGFTQDMDNAWLRSTFPARKKEPAPGPGPRPQPSPAQRLDKEVCGIRQDVADLAARVGALRSILGADGLPIVDEIGIPMEIVRTIDEEFRFGVTGLLYPWGGVHASRNPASAGGREQSAAGADPADTEAASI
jgi:hypothetical protein